jgi:DnaK suppressor protein
VRKRDKVRIRKILVEQRETLVDNVQKALAGDVHLDRDNFSDEIDTATSETSIAFTGRLRERERGLLNKIDETLEKLEQNVFGECEKCGEEIGVKRLLARPVAALCIDCKAEQETIERRMG